LLAAHPDLFVRLLAELPADPETRIDFEESDTG
jgi:hypothetical protein